MYKKWIFRAVSICLLLAWMGFIFTLSSQNAKESSATSGRVITVLLKCFYPSFGTLSDAAKAELIGHFQFFARKAAHFLIYAALGAFAFLSVLPYPTLKIRYRILAASAICFLYSVSDEWHQTVVSGRSGELRDILIDSSGAIAAILVLWLLCVWIKPIYRRVKYIGTREA